MKPFATNKMNMKNAVFTNNLRSLVGFLGVMMMLLFSATDVYSQESRTATLTSEGIVQISENDVPDGRFVIDVSHMEFESGSAMTNYFMERSGENFMFRALPHENKVIMLIRGNAQPDWGVAEWNAHLASELSDNAIK